jgi:hypothetical protein
VIGHQRGGIWTTTTHEHEHVQGKLFQDLWSPRETIGSLTQEFKRSYIDEKLTVSKRRKKIRRAGKVDAAAVCQAEITRS